MAAGWAAERLVVDAGETTLYPCTPATTCGLRGDHPPHHPRHPRFSHHPRCFYPYMEAFVHGLAPDAD